MTGSASATDNRHIVEQFGYRPDIDGLRAIAVIAVLLFHAGLGFPGGYVGVDVFFVISGFLITSLITRDLENDTFTLTGFWERRVRRIWPPLMAVVGATLFAGWFLLLPEDYVELAKSVVWQIFCGANFFFWQESGYFAGPADQKPLLHTWSLAVEEQFYIFVPLLLLGLAKTNLLSRRVLLAFFGIVSATSFALSVYGVSNHPSATFYLLPTRAWELAMGAMIASASVKSVWFKGLRREAVSCLGLAAVLLPCFLYSRSTPFPGLAALPPCLGTVILILANSQVDGQASARVYRLLSSRLFVQIGLMSYSLYLWHWPVFAFSRYWTFGSPGLQSRLLLLLLSAMLAALSWRFIETPIRRKTILASRHRLFASAIICSLLAVIASGIVVERRGFVSRLPSEARKILAQTEERTSNRQAASATPLTSVADIREDGLFKLGNTNDPLEFIVWGDSHAKVALPAFDELAKQKGISGRAAILFSTPPFVETPSSIRIAQNLDAEYPEELLRFIAERGVRQVYLCGYWSLYVRNLGEEEFKAGFLQTIHRLQSMNVKVLVLLDVPTHEIDVPKAMIGASMFPFLTWQLQGCTESEHRDKNSSMYELSTMLREDIQFIDPSSEFFDEASGRFLVMRRGVPLYFDDNHLTQDGTLTVLLPSLSQPEKTR